jgi:predicted nucleic acid-binding protein
MAMQFVDTNVFLRLLTGDDPAKAARCRQLFARAVAGRVHLRTSELVIAEIVWTLLSYYELPKGDVIEKVVQILNTPNLTVDGIGAMGPARLRFH